MQVFFINGNHWVCVSNKLSNYSVEMFDSLHTVPKEDGEIACQVLCIVTSTSPSFDMHLINVHCLGGYNECGLFTLA